MAARIMEFDREELVKSFRRFIGGIIAGRLIEEVDARFLRGRPLNQYNPIAIALLGNAGIALASRQFEEQIPEQARDILEDVRTSLDVIAGRHLDAVLFKKVPYGFCVSKSEIKVYNLDRYPPTKVIIDGRELTEGTDYNVKDAKEAMTITLLAGKELASGTREIIVLGTNKAAYFTCTI